MYTLNKRLKRVNNIISGLYRYLPSVFNIVFINVYDVRDNNNGWHVIDN